MKSLNPRQEAFARAVAAGHSVASAYTQAGYAPNDGNAYKLAQREVIRKRIEALRSEIAATYSDEVKSTGITVARTLQELGFLGFSDIRDMFNDQGELLAPWELPEHIARAVASIEVVTQKKGRSENAKVEHIHKIKLHDKNSALDKIAKHLQMYLEHEAAQSTAHAQLTEALQKIIAAKPALPIGPAPRPYLVTSSD